MAVPKKVTNFLDKNKVKYSAIDHKKVFTALDKAATLKTKPGLVAKTLVVKFDKEAALVAIPAHRNLDKNKIKKAASALRKAQGKKSVSKISFGTEKWIQSNLRGVKIGAVPPLGVLWKMPTFADNALLRNRKILINSGDHRSSLEIVPKDWEGVAEVIKGSFGKAK